MAHTQSPLTQEYILLGLINQSPIHGYELYKKVKSTKSIALIWHVKQSLLYAMLEKLEANGLLTSSTVLMEERLPRKVYAITEHGRVSLSDWLTTPVQHGYQMRQEFLAKLYFTMDQDQASAAELIDRQKVACQGWLTRFEDSISNTQADQRNERLIFQYRKHQIKAMIEWLDYCLSELSDHNLEARSVERE